MSWKELRARYYSEAYYQEKLYSYRNWNIIWLVAKDDADQIQNVLKMNIIDFFNALEHILNILIKEK